MAMFDEGARAWGLWGSLALGLLASACGDDQGPSGVDTTDGETTANTIGASGSLDTSGSSSSSTTGMLDGSSLDSATTEGPPPMPQPNGSMCEDDSACESGLCFQHPMLGDVCSECRTNEDCGRGTCYFDFTSHYAMCTHGEIGVMCSTDEGCMDGLVCAEVWDGDGAGQFPNHFCSECNASTPCAGGQVCSPVYDDMLYLWMLGALECLDPGSVPNGGGCPLDDRFVGDGTVCQSGLCDVVNLGAMVIGVCGECLTDMDCLDMQTCTPGMAELGSGILQGAMCR